MNAIRILGISGGLDYPHENQFRSTMIHADLHDAAAVLIDDGKIIAAIEEERLNRIKHTGKLPVHAIAECLSIHGIGLDDIDRIVYYCAETEVKFETVAHRDRYTNLLFNDPKACFAHRLQTYFGVEVDRSKIVFVNHHLCHAASAFYMSGFDRSLVLTIDGASPEGSAGMVIQADGNTLTPMDYISNDNSLGAFYTQVIDYLGYKQHDEYKVMGLAPYGDPQKFRRLFKRAFTLLPEGKYLINRNWYFVLMESIKPRLKGEPFTQEHRDVAAALQEALETIVLHVLTYYREKTGHTKLCMAGGVAHNCSMNGRILYSGLFDEIFVQPAAHDAGNALGGALYVSQQLQPDKGTEKLSHLYWGSDIQDDAGLRQLLQHWDGFITFRKEEHIAVTAARLIAEGSVIGWVQGRSEFGPRSLGNRSILADPRPADNKTIINEMVKKREGYRPFAPSVLEEYVGEYYELPATRAPYSYMNFVLKTKEDKQALLGAVTHVDGTARIQTVSKETNARYWTLIDEFRKLSGVPVLLNTSFNNNVEPIIDSEEDAIVSFLTTNIHHLIIGDYVIDKVAASKLDNMQMVPRRPIGSELQKTVGYTSHGDPQVEHVVRLHFEDKYKQVVSAEVFRILELSDGERTLEDLCEQLGYMDTTKDEISDAFMDLWSKRLVNFRPCLRSSFIAH